MNLAAIIGTAGFFLPFSDLCLEVSLIREYYRTHMAHPTEAMTLVPGLGNMNTVSWLPLCLVCFDSGNYDFHIINAVRSRDLENTWFDQNAVCGLVFYGMPYGFCPLFLTGHALPGRSGS